MDPEGTEALGATENPLPVNTPRRSYVPTVASILVVLLGIILLAGASLSERRTQEGGVWTDAVVIADAEPPWDGTLSVRARSLPDENFPRESAFRDKLLGVAGAGQLLDVFGLEHREQVIAVSLPDETWSSLLADGRLPEPGKPEVLAGSLVRLESFMIDGVTFRVVGRMHRTAAGLPFTYLIPDEDKIAAHFTEEAGGTTGWIDPEGAARLEAKEVEAPKDGLEQAPAPAALVTVALGIAGILLALVGGAFAQMRFLRWLATHRTVFSPILRPLTEWWRLLLALHVIHYGVFACGLLLAVQYPLVNYRLQLWVSGVFSEGHLSYIGTPYAEGDIVGAATTTFFNNFGVVTFASNIVPSVLLPPLGTCFGVLKTFVALLLAGFVMSPVWPGLIEVLPLHAVTLTLELEPYVIASFMVILYPVRLVQVLMSNEPWIRFKQTGLMMASGTLLVAAMLAIAAIYEAFEVVLLLK